MVSQIIRRSPSHNEDERILSFDPSFLNKPRLFPLPPNDLFSRCRTSTRCCELPIANILNYMMPILAIFDVPL